MGNHFTSEQNDFYNYQLLFLLLLLNHVEAAETNTVFMHDFVALLPS